MKKNLLKARLRGGDTVLGAFLGFPAAAVVEACGLAGLDFLLFDAEHGTLTAAEGENLVRAAEGIGITPLVRVGQHTSLELLRWLDVGVLGVQAAMVQSADDARNVVAGVKYQPEGRRGLGPSRANDYGLRGTFADYVREANAETLVIVQIETAEAAGRAAEIARVPGVDVVFIGPSDLSNSMGHPGRPDHPDVAREILRVKDAALAAGKVVGTIARDAGAVAERSAQGFRFLATGVVPLLAGAVRTYVGR